MCDNTEIDMMYKSVKTYKDLLNVNIKFLKGEIEQTLYHLAPVNEETIPLLDNLIRLNKLGYYTTGGQPALCEYNEQVKIEPNVVQYYSMEQKPFIEGLIEKKIVKKLTKFLKEQHDMYYLISYKNNKTETNIPFGDDMYNMTREKSHVDINMLKDEPWSEYTNIPNIYQETETFYDEAYYHHNEYPNIVKLIDKCYHLIVVGKEYGKDIQLEERLLEFFTKK